MNDQKTKNMLLLKKTGGIIMSIAVGGLYIVSLIAANKGESLAPIIGVFSLPFLLGLLFYKIGSSYLKKNEPSEEEVWAVNQFFKVFFRLFIPAMIAATIFIVSICR